MKNEVLTYEEGKLAIKIVRESILSCLNDHIYECEYDLPEVFHDKFGVFVTLNKSNNLRGCIGYPEAHEKLIDALLDLSLESAFDDPRFNPLTKDEYEDISIEISILTKAQQIPVNGYEEYFSKIELGTDGLILEKGYHRALFLPQVATEQNWNIEEYLTNLCYKAGLSSTSWMDDDCVLYKFQAQIINE